MQRNGEKDSRPRPASIVHVWKKIPPVKSEDDLDRVRNLERETVRVDEEIDRRVYVLYGLTPDEIKIVEGK